MRMKKITLRVNASEACDRLAKNLFSEFEPNEHSMRYQLSSFVAKAFESHKNSRSMRSPYSVSLDTYQYFGLKDVPFHGDPSIYFQPALQEKIEFDSTLEELTEIAEKMRSHDLFWHFIPTHFGYTDVRNLQKPFWFLHFTTRDKVFEIADQGFVGREDVENLYSTKHGAPSPIGMEGYVFGYLLQANSAQEAVDQVMDKFKHSRIAFEENFEKEYDDESYDPDLSEYPWHAANAHFVVAKALAGIDAYHLMDKERQVIVPTACIDQDSIFGAVDMLDEYIDGYDL